jgi:hypothetical protein
MSQCEHDLRLDRGTKDGFRFRVAVCSKCLGVWPDGRMSMPWTMRDPCWWWGENGALIDVPDELAGVKALPPEDRAKQAPRPDRY